MPKLSNSNRARKAILIAVTAAFFALLMVPGAAQALPLAPSVTSVSPNHGPTSGGNSVTLTGSGFLTVSSVSFGGIAGGFVTPLTDNIITVTAPPRGFSGTVHVVVGNAGGFSGQTFSDEYSYDGTPVVTGLSQNFGPIGGGTFIEVTGSGFTGAMAVTFGGVAGTGLTVLDDNHLTIFSPPHLGGGSVFVVVWVNGVPSGGSFASTFTYGGGLQVTSVSPAVGPPSGGTEVTITGAGFSGATAVSFGGVFGTILQIQSDGLLIAETPAHFSGSVHVNVWVGATSSPSTIEDLFLYNGGVTVFDLTPSSGPSTGGTAVTITGSGFFNAEAVTFGGISATSVVVENDGEILAVAPPHAPGAVDVVVFDGDSSSIETGAGVFTYTSALSVTGINPSSGPTSGGTTVTVSGTGFLSATSVAFGGTSAANLDILSDNELTVTAPAHAAGGSVHVTVFAGGTASAASAADLFTYVAPPASDPPARFAGLVTMNGVSAPPNTGVQAYIGSTLCGSSTVFPSGGTTRYVIDVAPADATHPGCGTDGVTVDFWVGGFQAQSGLWHNYQLTNLDLAVGGAAPATPPPPPTAPPTVSAPLPPNTGSLAPSAGSNGNRSWVLLVLLGTAAMVVGTGAMAGMRRRHEPIAVSAAIAPAHAHADASPGEAPVRRRGGGWLAIASVGAAAVVAGTVITKRRRK